MSDITYVDEIEVQQKGQSPTVGECQWAFSIPVWPYRIDWFDALAVLCGLVCSAVYSWYIGYWLKGMSIGMLNFIMGWMIMEWFILGDDGPASREAHKKEA